MLAAKGSSVTQVGGQQSKHQYGMAVDVAPVRNGVLVISEKDAWAATAYALLGEEAERLGLTWGGAGHSAIMAISKSRAAFHRCSRCKKHVTTPLIESRFIRW